MNELASYQVACDVGKSTSRWVNELTCRRVNEFTSCLLRAKRIEVIILKDLMSLQVDELTSLQVACW